MRNASGPDCIAPDCQSKAIAAEHIKEGLTRFWCVSHLKPDMRITPLCATCGCFLEERPPELELVAGGATYPICAACQEEHARAEAEES